MPASDEVDRIVDAWCRERPDLNFAPLQVLSRVGRLAKHLDRARRTAFSRSELESWEFDVLSALRRAGTPYELSPKLLLQQTLVTSGTMTNRIDRLVERDLVTRRTDPHDGRGILVGMTQGGLTGWMRQSRASSTPKPSSWQRSPRRSKPIWPACCVSSRSTSTDPPAERVETPPHRRRGSRHARSTRHSTNGARSTI